jgi:hypothetical protein
MNNYSDEEIVEFLKFISLKDQVNFFRDDFINKFVEYFHKNTDEDKAFVRVLAMDAFNVYQKNGLIYMFNEFKFDESLCKAIAYVINN